MSSGFRVSKTGFDVGNTLSKNLSITSTKDTLKIARTGTITLSLPSETITGGTNTERTASFAHGLGYAPVFTPFVNEGFYTGNITTGGDYVVNDMYEGVVPAGAYGPGLVGEVACIQCDNSNITVLINRYSMLFDVPFGARIATLKYTIFYNKIDEVVDYS